MQNKNHHPLQWAVDGPPLGHWTTEQGSFNSLMQDQFRFYPDGTGFFQSETPSDRFTNKFLWQFIRKGTLNVFAFDENSEDPNYFDDGSNDPGKAEN